MGLDPSRNGSSETMFNEEDQNLLSDSRVGNNSVDDDRSRRPVLCPQMSRLTILGLKMQAVEVDALRDQHTQASLDGLQ